MSTVEDTSTPKPANIPPKISNKLPKSSITKKVSLQYYRKQAVERTSKTVKLLPQFIKFISKLTPEQIAALKYYKGPGSFFQTDLIINNIPLSKIKPKTKPKYGNIPMKTHELRFPFEKFEDEMMRDDILGKQVALQYPLWLPNMSDIPNYINNSYGIRVKLLNILDTVFTHADCPKLSHDIILFRGMSEVPDKRKIKAGEPFVFDNFISTSIDRLIAERFSNGGYIFVLSGFKDVPCIYTPNSKTMHYKYATSLTNQSIRNDLSELTLPRGLEFKIDKVEQRHISSQPFGQTLFMPRGNNYGKLLSALRKKGLAPESVDEAIEDVIHSKATFVYCSFVKWTQQPPINFKELKKSAKFVLDINALNSWQPERMNWEEED